MSKPLVGCLVLIVEDEPLIAMDIANGLIQAGAQVEFSRTLREATEKAELPNLTAAIIDHTLQDGVTTSDVCAKLKERNIPFIVYSGYRKLEGACADGELVHKPANPELLVTTLSGVLAQNRRSIN